MNENQFLTANDISQRAKNIIDKIQDRYQLFLVEDKKEIVINKNTIVAFNNIETKNIDIVPFIKANSKFTEGQKETYLNIWDIIVKNTAKPRFTVSLSGNNVGGTYFNAFWDFFSAYKKKYHIIRDLMPNPPAVIQEIRVEEIFAEQDIFLFFEYRKDIQRVYNQICEEMIQPFVNDVLNALYNTFCLIMREANQQLANN